jgi:hypothetical protein
MKYKHTVPLAGLADEDIPETQLAIARGHEREIGCNWRATELYITMSARLAMSFSSVSGVRVMRDDLPRFFSTRFDWPFPDDE